MLASNLVVGDVVAIPHPFSTFESFNHEMVVETNNKEVKLVRVFITPGTIKGVKNQIVPFVSLQERVVRRKDDVPFTLISRGG